jgi:hypothetical protein
MPKPVKSDIDQSEASIVLICMNPVFQIFVAESAEEEPDFFKDSSIASTDQLFQTASAHRWFVKLCGLLGVTVDIQAQVTLYKQVEGFGIEGRQRAEAEKGWKSQI